MWRALRASTFRAAALPAGVLLAWRSRPAAEARGGDGDEAAARAQLLRLSRQLRLLRAHIEDAELSEGVRIQPAVAAAGLDARAGGAGGAAGPPPAPAAPAVFPLPDRIDAACAAAMVECFERGGTISADDLLRLIADAEGVLGAGDTIQRVPEPGPGECVTIVGDLHGSTSDLARALREAGRPGPGRTLIFNGDFVDRGDRSVEVLAALLALKLAHPRAVVLNRGNHEDAAVAEWYGFGDELAAKFGERSDAVLGAAERLFWHLPLGAVVGRTAMVVHAGLPEDGAALRELEGIRRSDKLSATTVLGMGDELDDVECRECELTEGLLWSDPDPEEPETRYNSKRNAGCVFGPAHTRAWLEREGLRMLVRSHECVPDGCARIDCGGGTELWTVFSVSQYPFKQGVNAAGALQLRGGAAAPACLRWDTCAAADEPDALRARVRESLCELLFRHKHALLQRCEKAGGGRAAIDVAHWAAAMRAVTGLNAGWAELLPLMGHSGSAPVDYRALLDRVAVRWRGEAGTAGAAAALYRRRARLRAALPAGGAATAAQFAAAWRLVARHGAADAGSPDPVAEDGGAEVTAAEAWALLDPAGRGTAPVSDLLDGFEIVAAAADA